MVKEDDERKLAALHNALSAAHASIRQGNYTAAFDNIQLVKGMIPSKYKGSLETAYKNAEGEVRLFTRYALEGAQTRLSSGYTRVSGEMGRISHGGKPMPVARRTIKDMEGLVEYLTGPGMPAEISNEFTPHKDRIGKLKKELEVLATSKGAKIDWSAE